jgi:hypothetical protein
MKYLYFHATIQCLDHLNFVLEFLELSLNSIILFYLK